MIQNDENSSYNGLTVVYRQQVSHGFSGRCLTHGRNDRNASTDSKDARH